jgi:hypothetical protein
LYPEAVGLFGRKYVMINFDQSALERRGALPEKNLT